MWLVSSCPCLHARKFLCCLLASTRFSQLRIRRPGRSVDSLGQPGRPLEMASQALIKIKSSHNPVAIAIGKVVAAGLNCARRLGHCGRVPQNFDFLWLVFFFSYWAFIFLLARVSLAPACYAPQHSTMMRCRAWAR